MSETSKYFGRWSNWEEMQEEWRGDRWYSSAESEPVEGMATDDEVLFASYGGGAYEGSAFVLFTRDGKLYEVNGGHCSCYGLEGQWAPEETTWTAIAMRPIITERNEDSWHVEEYTTEGLVALRALVVAHSGAA